MPRKYNRQNPSHMLNMDCISLEHQNKHPFVSLPSSSTAFGPKHLLRTKPSAIMAVKLGFRT